MKSTEKISKATSRSDLNSAPFFPKKEGDVLMRQDNQDHFFSAPIVQTKLNIGKPGDKYEQEADAVADRVVGGQSAAPVLSTAGSLNRKCAECDQEDKVQRVEEEEIQPKSEKTTPTSEIPHQVAEPALASPTFIQAQNISSNSLPYFKPQTVFKSQKSNHSFSNNSAPEVIQKDQENTDTEFQNASASHSVQTDIPTPPQDDDSNPNIQANARTYGLPQPGLETRLNTSKGKGNKLPESTLAEMEGSFGASLEDVRIHTDQEAVTMNQQLGAKAFAHGSDIYFNEGGYNLISKEGRHLLAHELTHVLQQENSLNRIQRNGNDDTSQNEEGVGDSESEAIGMRWQGTVRDTIIRHFRPIISPILSRQGNAHEDTQRQLRQVIDTLIVELNAERAFVVRHTNEAGEREMRESLTNVEAEELVNEWGIANYTLSETGVRRILSMLNISMEDYQAYNEVREIWEGLDSLSEQLDGSALSDLGSPFDEQAPEPTARFSQTVPPEDQAFAIEQLHTIFGETEVSGENLPEDIALITASDVEALRTLSQLDESTREGVIELLREARQRGSQSEGDETSDTNPLRNILETATEVYEMQQAQESLGEDLGEGDREEPIRRRPVHGQIVNVGPSTLSKGQEGMFRFQTEDNVDAFRVPHVHIGWYLIRYRDGNSDNKTRANIETVDTENTHYIEVREQGILNDRIFNADFNDPIGTFEIRAFVDHNFFLPAHFTLPNIIVKPPLQVIDQLRAAEEARAAEDENIHSFGDPGTRLTDGTNFEFDDLTTHDQGYRYFGQLSEERFEAGTGDFSDSFRTLDQQITEMQDLINHYQDSQRDHGQDNADLIQWAQQRLSRLQSTRGQLAGFEEGGANHAIAIQGFYVSRSAGVGHSPLNLAAWFSYDTEENEYNGHIFDHTNLFGLDNPHVTASNSSYLEMLEELFVEISSAYPNGMMSVTFQQYSASRNPIRQTVTYERVTDTLTGDIRGVVFSAPVSFVVNAVSAILTVFPPTTGIGIGLSLVYNGAATALEVSEAYRTDTLRASQAVDVGLVALDVIPAIGRLSRLARAGRTAESAVRTAQIAEEAVGIYRVLSVGSEVVQASGDFYMFTEEAIRTIDQRINNQIIELAEIEGRISTLQRQGAPASVIAVERARATRLQTNIRNTTVETLAELGSTQAFTIASQRGISALAHHHLGRRRGLEGDTDPEGSLIPEPPTRDRDTAEAETETQTTRDRSETEAQEADGQQRRRSTQPDPQAELPNAIVVGGSPVEVRRGAKGLDEHEVRVRYEPGPMGMVGRIYVEAGPNARNLHLQQHLMTVRALQRFQGLGGLARIAIRRAETIMANYIGMGNARPAVGSAAFEAEFEIQKLPEIIQERASRLLDPNLDPGTRADILAEINHLELDLERHIQTLERMAQETGQGFIAATVPRSNPAALAAGYPNPPAGHYYMQNPAGGFQLRRFAHSQEAPKMVVWENGQPIIRDRTNTRTNAPLPDTLLPGETRQYTGADGNPAVATRRGDGTVVIRSAIGPGHGRQGFERTLLLGVDVGLEGWERAHSQGQGTGHESPYGILYAPSEVNQAIQNRGIEQHIRDIFSQVDSQYPLFLTTETSAHSGTSRLSEINYRIELEVDGQRRILYEASINVQDRRTDPRVEISATGYSDFEQFMVRPPEGPHRRSGTPDPEPIGPAPESPEARLAMEDVQQVRERLQAYVSDGQGNDLQRRMAEVFAAELGTVQQDLGNNPTDMAATNAREVLDSIRDQFPQF